MRSGRRLRDGGEFLWVSYAVRELNLFRDISRAVDGRVMFDGRKSPVGKSPRRRVQSDHPRETHSCIT